MSAQQQAALSDFMERYCEFCERKFVEDPHVHLANCEHADDTTRNHGGVCELCEKVVKGPLHEHFGTCSARDDVWQDDHPESGGESA